MELYLIRRALRLLNVTIHCENIRSIKELTIALLSKKEREIFLEKYLSFGILEAKKHFIVDPGSEKGSFLETFIFKPYSHCNFKDKSVIDIGAQTGDSTLYFSQRGARLIYAFEPLEGNFKILQNNIINNKINCYCYNTGLGNKVGIINIDISGNQAKPAEQGLESETMNIDRLDSYSIAADIVKIDVEGFEMEVLKGGLNVIKNANTIIIETHSKDLRVEVAKFLSPLGFQFKKSVKTYLGKNIRVEFWYK